MNTGRIVLIGAGVGSTLGGLIPSFWGASPFSFTSLIFGGIGAFLGIWFSYQIAQRW